MTGKYSTPIATLKQKKFQFFIDRPMLILSMLPDAYSAFLPNKISKNLNAKHLLQYVFLPDHATFMQV